MAKLPPNPFKILLYFPEDDVFVTSGVYERYAFDSYYHIKLPKKLVLILLKQYLDILKIFHIPSYIH